MGVGFLLSATCMPLFLQEGLSSLAMTNLAPKHTQQMDTRASYRVRAFTSRSRPLGALVLQAADQLARLRAAGRGPAWIPDAPAAVSSLGEACWWQALPWPAGAQACLCFPLGPGAFGQATPNISETDNGTSVGDRTTA